MKKGKVYLVGAGPGDPGLITQKGLDCLALADVVVYDRLLDERLLGAAPPEAERIYVGKSPARHTMKQEEISRLLVARAGAGKAVVRLKGGDPFVFGRGGEEAQALHNEGIPFEIVPGVSSATAVPAYAGIPVTHRGSASSFAVITGHEDPAKAASGIDWAKLATGVDTLVFLMGRENLPEIAAQLIKHGRAPDTPAAVISEGTRPGQATVAGTLGDIAAKAKERGLGSPAVVVVGEVVGLREELRWYDNRPLSGKRILVTRSLLQAGALSHLLSEQGARAIELPAIDIRPVADSGEMENAIRNLNRYQWLLFTSVNGVDEFFKYVRALGLDARALAGLKVGAIGPATGRALEARGITPDYVPDAYTGRELVTGLKSRDVSGQKFLLLRADIADDELVKGLQELGAEADEVSAYRTVPAEETLSRAVGLLLSGGIDVVTFASPSTVRNLVVALEGRSVPDDIVIACIGPKTAAAAKEAGLRVDIMADEHTISGLVAAIEDYYTKET